jgi:hypothetical protein
MAGSRFEPVRRSPRRPERRRLTTLEAVSLTLAAFAFCATALGQFRSEVHGPPGAIERGSIVGPLMLGALVALPALASLLVRLLLRRR